MSQGREESTAPAGGLAAAPAGEAAGGEHALNLAWLVRLRWVAVAGQLATLVAVSRMPGLSIDLAPLVAIVAVVAVSNLALALWSRRRSEARESSVALVMLLDVCLLTALLWLSGGPYNPFSFLYLVHIALAAVILRPAWTWALVVASGSAYGALFVLHPPPLMRGVGAEAHLEMHLEGMWVAFAVASVVIAFFVGRVRRALAERDRALAAARDRSQRAERLASLATLAAGAAHELSTPLATITVVAHELERHLEGRGADAEDARLIRSEVERCRAVLDHLVADAGESAGEAFAPVEARAVAEQAVKASKAPDRVRVDASDGAVTIRVPRHALVQALKGLVDNATAAVGEGGEVVVSVRTTDGRAEFEVADDGPGMSSEILARAGEPFFTTRPAGGGMGLGLFVARSLAERLGGVLEIDSEPGAGTRVRLSVASEGATDRRIDADGAAI